MTNRPETELDEQQVQGTLDDRTTQVVEWLESEFPGWQVTVDETATWEGKLHPIWIARQEGHHPQAEMTPAKLHTRLTEYLDREQARKALMN